MAEYIFLRHQVKNARRDAAKHFSISARMTKTFVVTSPTWPHRAASMTAEIEPRVQAYHPTLPKIGQLFARGKMRAGRAEEERALDGEDAKRVKASTKLAQLWAEDRSVSIISEALKTTKAKVIPALYGGRVRLATSGFSPGQRDRKVAQERDRVFPGLGRPAETQLRSTSMSVILDPLPRAAEPSGPRHLVDLATGRCKFPVSDPPPGRSVEMLFFAPNRLYGQLRITAAVIPKSQCASSLRLRAIVAARVHVFSPWRAIPRPRGETTLAHSPLHRFEKCLSG